MKARTITGYEADNISHWYQVHRWSLMAVASLADIEDLNFLFNDIHQNIGSGSHFK